MSLKGDSERDSTSSIVMVRVTFLLTQMNQNQSEAMLKEEATQAAATVDVAALKLKRRLQGGVELSVVCDGARLMLQDYNWITLRHATAASQAVPPCPAVSPVTLSLST